MKLSGFFKLVKRKINKYDRYAENPFINPNPTPITIVWVENGEHNNRKPDL